MKTDKYSDIIGLPHHVSPNHPKMSMMQRAAQFAPFAALVGFEDSIREEGSVSHCVETTDCPEEESSM